MNNQKKISKPLLIIGMGIIIVLLSAIVFLLAFGKGDDTQKEKKRNVVVTQDNVEEVVNDMLEQEFVPTGYYNTKMSATWHFTKGNPTSEDAYVANTIDNTNDVYFDVFLKDDESEPIYESPVIPRGAELKDITFEEPLEAGSHDCVVVYHLIDEAQNTISTLRVALTIIVE